jgi:hypothetical protein
MFVIKVIRNDDEPQFVPPFEDRQQAFDWVKANAWRSPYHADRVELHQVETTDRKTAQALAQENAGDIVLSLSRQLTAEEQEHHDREGARALLRDLVKDLKAAKDEPPPPRIKRRL